MKGKTLLVELIEREREYVATLNEKSEDYNKSIYRLMDLEKQLAEHERSEADAERRQLEATEDQKDRKTKNIIEAVKVGSGIMLPLIGLVWITATEKEVTFTGALREYTKCFLPKK